MIAKVMEDVTFDSFQRLLVIKEPPAPLVFHKILEEKKYFTFLDIFVEVLCTKRVLLPINNPLIFLDHLQIIQKTIWGKFCFKLLMRKNIQ